MQSKNKRVMQETAKVMASSPILVKYESKLDLHLHVLYDS